MRASLTERGANIRDVKKSRVAIVDLSRIADRGGYSPRTVGATLMCATLFHVVPVTS